MSTYLGAPLTSRSHSSMRSLRVDHLPKLVYFQALSFASPPQLPPLTWLPRSERTHSLPLENERRKKSGRF
uniref:Uncharacterized protein n=1 Tax=Anguilla anguilla TaxID=7936 RepID=A0A0E9PHT0_ANGAN